ncbi:MAG: AMP-binding protein [Actinomycetota bacterium]|nr:AMP-binding protein [Actinomycetota bacterium]
MGLTDWVLAKGDEQPGKTAVIEADTGTVTTYGDLSEAVESGARGLTALGVGRGDVFGICLPNGLDFCVAFHAALRTGAAVTTVSPLASGDDLAFQLRHARVRHLATTAECAERVRQVTAGPETVLVAGEESWPAVMEGRGGALGSSLGAGDLAVVPYSSGTTGLPKGVMLSHGNLVSNLRQVEPVDGIDEGDRAIAVLPFSHIYGMQEVMNLTLLAGATLVTLPRFDLGHFLAAIEEYRITRASLVPPILRALARDPLVDDYDLSSLRRIFSGAAPLPAEVATACAERLHCEVRQGYGLTEASPVTHLMPAGAPHKPSSIGPPLPGTECRVVDLDSRLEVAPGASGELWVRGPQVMQGYLDDPAATAHVLDAEGWLHTGDLVSVDSDGYFSVVDRVKELVKYKGYQVSPAELEAVLLTHPAVADAAVVASPDEEAGEVPKAFVVLSAETSGDDLIAYVAGRVAPFKRVRRVEAVHRIPRSPAGKLLRRELTAREGARVQEDPSPV